MQPCASINLLTEWLISAQNTYKHGYNKLAQITEKTTTRYQRSYLNQTPLWKKPTVELAEVPKKQQQPVKHLNFFVI